MDLKYKKKLNPLTSAYLFCIALTYVSPNINMAKVRKKVQPLILPVTLELAVKNNQNFSLLLLENMCFITLFIMFTDLHSGTCMFNIQLIIKNNLLSINDIQCSHQTRSHETRTLNYLLLLKQTFFSNVYR